MKNKSSKQAQQKALHKAHVMCCGVWEKYEGQVLETNDLLWTNHGLAFVDSGHTTGEPSRISSMPEAWSFSFENGDIHKRKRVDGSAFVSKTGRYYRETAYDGKCAGKILYVCKVRKP